ncbi:MAG TPA: ATP-binding protein [Permianibacter sp.]|nr:ATP-binding protein [Permianibacter sp.]
MSLRRYLLSTLLGLLALLLLISALAGYSESRHELEEVFDAQLAQHAKVLRASLAPAIERQAGLLAIESWHNNIDVDEHGDENEAWERDALGHAYENKIAFQLWSAEGKLQARSDSAPFTPFSDFVAGYSEMVHGEHTWRVFTLSNASGGWIQVGHRDDVRGELSAEIALQTIWPALLLMPVMALVILLSLRHALKPLKTLTRTLGERSPSELAPLPVDTVPEEVQPLVRGFNALMARLEEAFQQQKRFIADAAHELKTPLAALQIHTENALAEDGEARAAALLHVKEGIVRTNRLVEQLLLLSRLEHLRQPGPQQSAPKATLELGQATRQLFAELTVLAERRQQRLLLECPVPQTISGNELVLRALLRNLLDNALRYSPAGSDVSVQIFRDDSALCWRVCDQGPGISTDQQEQVFEPFFRELGNEATGSGLGLAIAREAAMQLGASISLSSNSPSGLCVSVRWST